MRRIIVLLAAAALLCACYHDNASPFVHGANNDPMATGGTMVPATSSASEAGTTTMYDASSGRAGGVKYVQDTQMQGSPSESGSAMPAPAPAPAPTTAPAPAPASPSRR